MGRVGVITHRERHDGGFNIVHIKDAIDNSFATRESNVFVIGSEKPWISLPKGKGVYVFFSTSLPPRKAHANIPLENFLLQKREIVVGPMQLLVTRSGRFSHVVYLDSHTTPRIQEDIALDPGLSARGRCSG